MKRKMQIKNEDNEKKDVDKRMKTMKRKMQTKMGSNDSGGIPN